MSINDAMPNAFRIPFRDSTRKKGHWTVILSLVSLAMIYGNFWPEKITAFGLGFGTVNHVALCWVMIISITYCFSGFVIYAVYDGIENRAQFHLEEEEKSRRDSFGQPSGSQFYRAKRFHNPIHKRIYVAGMIHDCGIPLVLAIIAVMVLLKHIYSGGRL